MGELGIGLQNADHNEDALSVQQADLATLRRIGATEPVILDVQCSLAATYESLGRHESALQMKGDVYSGRLRIHGEEHERTLTSANNYAFSLLGRQRFEEAKSLLRKMMPVSRRVFGESHELALKMRMGYAAAIYYDKGATLEDLHEAVTTLEELERTSRAYSAARTRPQW